MFSLALLLLTATAHATDYGGGEGLFNNRGSSLLYCFKDIHVPSWQICVTPLPPGASCRADAVSTSERGPVFKIPNRSSFDCVGNGADVSCTATDVHSVVILQLARIHNGPVYGNLDWKRYYEIMTGGEDAEVVDCTAAWVPTPNMCPAPPVNFSSELSSLRQNASVLERVSRPATRP